jgi:hypothetical protein
MPPIDQLPADSVASASDGPSFGVVFPETWTWVGPPVVWKILVLPAVAPVAASLVLARQLEAGIHKLLTCLKGCTGPRAVLALVKRLSRLSMLTVRTQLPYFLNCRDIDAPAARVHRPDELVVAGQHRLCRVRDALDLEPPLVGAIRWMNIRIRIQRSELLRLALQATRVAAAACPVLHGFAHGDVVV